MSNRMREDWVDIELGEILKVSSGSGLTAKKMTGSGYPVYGGNGITGYHSEYLFDEQKLIIGRVGVRCGVTHITKSKAWVTDNALVVTFKQPFFDLRFMKLKLQFENLNKLSNSTAQPVISGAKIYAYYTSIPPLPEQRAIVAKIEELFSDLDKGITDLKRAQNQLKVYRQAVLKKAFEGEFTKEWREQNRFTKNDWKFPPLGEVLIQSKEKHKPENVENLFYVGLEHIGKETGNLTETVGVSEIKTVKNKFKTGQILYGKLRPYLNKVYLAKESGVCSTDILVFNLEDSIIGKFAVQFMLSRQFVNDMSANTNGVNLPRVSTKYVNNYKFPLPPTNEQHQIVQEIESRLSVCDKVEESITQSLEKAKALRQSILKKAFEGTLLSAEEIAACKAAPDYEPASVLLERIKAEKKKA